MTRVDVERWRRELRACRGDAEIEAWLARHIEKPRPPNMRWLATLIISGWGVAIVAGLAAMLIADWQRTISVLGVFFGSMAILFGTVWAVEHWVPDSDMNPRGGSPPGALPQ